MRRGFLNGYILKKDFKVHDDDATFIEVNLPNKKLDLSAIEFGIKYPQPRKSKQEKLDDLQKIRPSLQQDGERIDKLLVGQQNAHEYAEEEATSIFPIETLGIGNSLEPDAPVRIADPSPNTEEDVLSDENVKFLPFLNRFYHELFF